jgi:lipopolysaccharide export system protein LptA
MIVSIFRLANLSPSYQLQPLILRISILLLSASISYARDPVAEAAKNPMSLLPDGSVLHEVLLPRYDKDRVLIGDLKAEIMTRINPQKIQGENVLIKFYKPDRSLRGKIKLRKVVFNPRTDQLRADEPVEITTDSLVAKGSGLIYALQKGQGFLIGPSTTWISYTEPTTSMRPTPTKTASLLALCLAPSLTIAAPPAHVSEAELAEIKTSAVSVKPQLNAKGDEVKAKLQADLTAAKKASDAAHGFVKSAELKVIPSEPTPTEGSPLEIAPGPNDTVIKCDGGMYFDAEEGVLVYLKNVSVSDPRFTLKGADELKVFFDKKDPKKTAPTEKKEDDKNKAVKKPEASGPAANFGDVKKLIATGTVHFVQKSVGGKEPVEASGGILTYDVPKEEIIISQRYPWVKQGNFYARAKQPNLTLRLLNNGSFSTQGEWEMGGSNLKFNGR